MPNFQPDPIEVLSGGPQRGDRASGSRKQASSRSDIQPDGQGDIAARLFAPRVARIPGSDIDRSIALLQRQPHPVVPFAFGAPAPDALPSAELASIAQHALEDAAGGALSYGPTEGEPSLRAALLDDLRSDGLRIADDELLITAGGTQGLDLVMKLFVGPGDIVIAEDPTYPNGVAIATGYDGIVLRCPTDANGLVVEAIDALVARAGRAPKLIYTIPTFQNPGGGTLSLERRRALLQLVEQYDCILLEDDPYGRLWFDAPPPPSLYRLAQDEGIGAGRVVAVHTFSKIVAPGLRVGWIMAPASVIARMVDAKQGLDTCSNIPGQRMAAGFLASGALPRHLKRLRGLYRERRDAMEAALRRHFGNLRDLSWTSPGGGFFLWVTLPPSIDADALLDVALAEGVAFIPGSAFTGPDGARNAIRLSFAFPDAAAIDAGIAALRCAVDRVT